MPGCQKVPRTQLRNAIYGNHNEGEWPANFQGFVESSGARPDCLVLRSSVGSRARALDPTYNAPKFKGSPHPFCHPRACPGDTLRSCRLGQAERDPTASLCVELLGRAQGRLTQPTMLPNSKARPIPFVILGLVPGTHFAVVGWLKRSATQRLGFAWIVGLRAQALTQPPRAPAARTRGLFRLRQLQTFQRLDHEFADDEVAIPFAVGRHDDPGG